MNQKLTFKEHPVLILVGQLEECKKKLDQVIKERESIYSQIRYIDIEHDSLEDFFDFISVHCVTKKLVIGTIRKYDPHVISALLKKIEDPPTDVDFIFLGSRFPRVFLTRGMVYRIHTSPPDIIEQNLLEQYILTALLEGRLGTIEVGYKTWYKILEVRKWIESAQITQENGISMMKSIMEVAQIKLQNT